MKLNCNWDDKSDEESRERGFSSESSHEFLQGVREG